ncbi:MAG: restriction endonuclease subunit S [Nanoarchaeota archaeon]|nr:restriction endonuclease subunit S [Nanoarchaeota archaeon]
MTRINNNKVNKIKPPGKNISTQNRHFENDLPESWKIVKLHDVAEFINGRAFKPSEWGNKGLPIIRIQNLTESSSVINHYDGVYDKKYYVDTGDILLSWSATLDIFKWKKCPALLNQHIFKVKPKKDILSDDYFLYYLKTILQKLKDKTHGSGMKHITKPELVKQEMILPPLLTQKKIVAVLEKAEKLREWRKEADALTNEFLKCVFLDMFGDPVKNPKGWDIIKFEEILLENPQNGLYKPITAYGEGTPILRIDSFYDGKITNIGELKRLKCTKKEIEKFKVQIGDIMINRVNSLKYLGKCGLVQNLVEDMVYESNMMRIRIRTEILNYTFMTMFLCTRYIKNQILTRAKKAVNQASINQKDVNSLKILVPPIELQNKYASIVEKVEEMHDAQKQSKQEIDNLFDALMQKAFKGELV